MVDIKNLYLCYYCWLPGYWSLCPVCVEKRKLNDELCI